MKAKGAGALTLAAALLAAVDAVQEVVERASASFLYEVQWTPPQDEFLRVNVPYALLRIGNQWCGKSFVAAADVIYRCLGRHPYDPRGQIAPCKARVISPTGEHSIGFQEKVWELVPKHELMPGQEFVVGLGFRGRYKVLRFRNGSRIEFRTWGGAGKGDRAAMAQSGNTLDHIVIDELCPERLYEESKKRVARRNGTVRLTLTPINAAAAGGHEWLEKRCAAGEIKDLWFKLRPEYCVPIGATEPLRDPITKQPMTPEWCDWFRASTGEEDRDVVVDGAWPTARGERELAGWTESYVASDADIARAANLRQFAEFGVGIDYGEASGRTVALLLGWGPAIGVWALDEWVGDGKTPALEAGRAIVKMISARIHSPANVRHWRGDINAAGVILGQIGSMNEHYAAAINQACREAGLVLPSPIVINSPNKGRGTVDWRMRMINDGLSARRLRVYSGCNRLLTSMRTFRRGARDARVLKDPLDAFGYGAEPWWTTTTQPRVHELHRV